MKVANMHSAPIQVGAQTIKPGADATISADEAKYSGVQALLAAGRLAEVKASKKADSE